MRTEQEQFWAGEFGNTYIDRNSDPSRIAAVTATFAKIIARCRDIASVLELGANVGINMRALRHLLPSAKLAGVEINERAYRQLAEIPGVSAHHGSLLDFRAETDLVFTKGVLIHIDPNYIDRAYATLYESSRRYIAVIEYYNPSLVEVPYRGHSGKLFKRDWAGDLMRLYPDLRLVDYGFLYHLDPVFPEDDMTWFLLEKA